MPQLEEGVDQEAGREAGGDPEWLLGGGEEGYAGDDASDDGDAIGVPAPLASLGGPAADAPDGEGEHDGDRGAHADPEGLAADDGGEGPEEGAGDRDDDDGGDRMCVRHPSIVGRYGLQTHNGGAEPIKCRARRAEARGYLEEAGASFDSVLLMSSLRRVVASSRRLRSSVGERPKMAARTMAMG